ncbi:MAG TPA: hypothetical protein VM784_09805 [Actinomycetota bacterium]|nr:hypothetical protein [Actinomycetota bacterium]
MASPTNNRIAYGVGGCPRDCGGRQRLRTMRSDGSDDRLLTRVDFGCDTPTDWMGRRVLFVRECGLCRNVHWIGASGGTERQLTQHGPDDDYASRPQWLEGGRKVAYAEIGYSSPAGIFITNADGSGKRRLTEDTSVSAPSVSPDGRLIAFVATRRDRPPDVYVMRADGTHRRRVTDDVRGEGRLQWSPDGQRILFHSVDPSGGSRIYVVGRDGRGHRRLQPEGLKSGRDFDPYWSPDGEQIAFAGERRFYTPGSGYDLAYALFVMDAGGTTYRRVTDFEKNLRVWGWEPEAQPSR